MTALHRRRPARQAPRATKRRVRAAAGLLVFAGSLAAIAPAGAGTRDGVAQELARAVAEHPGDPDLRFALAAQLESIGDAAGAVAQFERYVAAHPDRRPDVWLRLGRLLARLGRDAEAVPHLERAVARDPNPGAAHLHLGISLRRLGRQAEAERHFARAGEIETGLAAETTLLRALSRIELGDEAGAAPLLARAIELDPEGDTGRSARLLQRSGARRAERPSRVRLEVFGGYESDTNVTLDGSDIPNVSDQRNDARAVWGAGITLHAIQRETLGLTLGVRYDQAEQEELSAFDTRRELAFASLRLTPTERVSLQLDALATRTRLDHRRYQRTRSLRPSLLFAIGDRAGVTRLFASLEEISYPEQVVLANLDRDGWALGGGLDHHVPVPWLRGAWLSLGADFRRYDTDSERDALFRFASPYDHDRWRATARLRSQLVWGFRTEASFSWWQERYEHRNLLDALTTDATPSIRRDNVLEARFALLRPVTRFADVEFRLQKLDRTSNVDIYEYDRRIAGVYLRFHTP